MVDDRIIFPATGYLCLVWETFGMMIGRSYVDVSVVIKNVKFNRGTIISKKGRVEIIVVIQKGNCFLLFLFLLSYVNHIFQRI